MKETKFKDTETGKIPEEWSICNFGDIFTFFSNNTLSRDMLGERGDMHNVHYGDVLIKYGSTLDVEKESIPSIKEEYCYKSTNKIEDGDVIIADTAEDETVGKACEILNVGSKYIVSGLHTIWVRPKGNLFAAKYLGYAMNGTTYHNQLLPLIQGTKVSSISKAAIKDTCIIVPPINEQHSIASALTSINNLISSLGKLIEKKKNIKQGAMLQLLTGQIRLKGFSEPWVEKTLGEMFEISAGGDLQKDFFSITRDRIHKYPIFSNSLECAGLYGYTSKPRFSRNSITITGHGTLGHAEIREIDFDAIIRILIMVPKLAIEISVIKDIINFFKPFVSESTGVPQLTVPQVQNASISFPKSIAEQRAIATILTKMDNEITALETKKAKYEAIKQGMMQQLLTGKIRLIS